MALPTLSPLDGALLVDKPATWTSHDVVAKLRNHFRLPKVGHCGTLDPMATGLLILVLGTALAASAVAGAWRPVPRRSESGSIAD